MRAPKARRLRTLLGLTLLLACAPAAGQVVCPVGAKTWTGATSNDWRTASNWSPAGVPGNGANVCFSTPNPAPVLTGGPPPRLTTIYVIAGTNLALTSAGGTMFLAGGIQSDGTFTFIGTRRLQASAAQTWALGAGSNTISWPVTFQSAVTLSGAGNLTLAGAIAGGARVTKDSTGVLLLAGTGSTHAGGFTINAGELRVTGSLGGEGTVAVNTGATLSGTGTLGSSGITVSSGAVYSPGLAGAGTLSSNGLTLSNATTLSFTVGTSTTRGAVTGALVLDGVLNVTAGAGFGQGTYTLFTATGAITNNSVRLGAVPAGFSYDYQVTGGSVLLKVGPPATSVELLKADAVSDGVSTEITWEAGTERRNLGYRVYREESGGRREVSGLVAGSVLRAGFDPVAGRNYSVVDRGGPGGARYWIQAIDLAGSSQWFGPVQAHGGQRSQTLTSALVTGLASASLLVSRPPDGRPVDPPGLLRSWGGANLLQQWAVAGSSGAVKLLVRQDGVYRVQADRLFAAGLPAGTPLSSLQLWAGGRPVAFRALSADGTTLQTGDAVEFFGQAADTHYTDTRVYWVTHGLGAPTSLGPAPATDATGQATSFRESLEVRDRILHISALMNPDTDGFFGPPIIGTGPTTRVFSTPAVDMLASEPAVLEVSVQGLTDGAHTLDVQVNGTTVGTLEGEFQEIARGSFTLPPGSLVAGDNTVTLVGRTANEIALELSQRLTYSRHYALAGPSRFTAPGGASLELTGTDAARAHVLDITSALSPTVVGTTASVTAASLVAPGTGARILYAYRDEDVLTPVVIPDAPSAWHAAREVDLLVIAPRSLLPALQPLADQREREGLRVALVDIEDVYDEFSAGQKDALAIRSFVSGALQAWSRPPRFLLLAGAATYDPRGWLGRPELDQVPTIPLATRYMETGSDDALVTLDGSEFPSLAVGRLPLSSLEDMQAVVAKILGRPLATPDGTVLLVHDRDANVAFSKASDEVKAALAGWRTQDLARGDDDDATHVQLLDRLRAGPAAVDYQGHGAEDMWNGRVLSTEDVGALSSSGGTTLLVASTCLNAYFLDLGRESLGQALLRTPGGGAWGLWASSALTLPIEHALLSKTLLVATLREGKTLGEATLAAKQAVTDLDVRRSFQLLGDPSARAVTSTPAALTVTPSRGPGAQGCSTSGSTRGSFAVLTVVGLWLLATRRRAAA